MRPPACRIDHVTITSPSLEAGRAFVHACLGVQPGPGGRHPRMGTHNALLRLGDALFLEVIAVDPDAPSPSRPRWFALDTLRPDDPPRLNCWVARTTDIENARRRTREAPGAIERLSRGALTWSIALPEDGSLPLGGVGPALIRWDGDVHPAASLDDAGCALVALVLRHPDPRRVSRLLDDLAIAEPGVVVTVEEAPTPGLVAHIATPRGIRSIGSP